MRDWRSTLPLCLPRARVYDSLIYITFSSVLARSAARPRRGGRAIVIREQFVAGAPLCVAIFSRIPSGTLRADNRMRNINHSIHLISAIIYTAPFARSFASSLNAASTMRAREIK